MVLSWYNATLMRKYTSDSFDYTLDFEKIDFRKKPELYQIGRGEQGVLMVQPYKSEILPHWRFKTKQIAEKSAKKIYSLFLEYKKQNDFVGMDMARKFLQMGYTRSRRYANQKSGRKYESNPQKTDSKETEKQLRQNIRPQEKDALTSEKANAAKVFYTYYLKAREDDEYKKMKQTFQMKKRLLKP